MDSSTESQEDTVWTDDELRDLEDRKFEWIKSLHDLGNGKRYWDDAKVGDTLPTRVIGPHSIASFTTEWRAYLFTTWRGVTRRTVLDIAALRFTDASACKKQAPVPELQNTEKNEK